MRAGAVARQPAIAASRRVIDRYTAAGGGLLANGLAYAALFAIVPAAVLLAGVVGLVYAEPVSRQAVVEVLVGVLPPMRELVETVLSEAVRDAAPISIIGGVTLAWGMSRFVVAFEGAIARVTGGNQQRGVLARNLVALVAVVLLVGAIPASAALSAATAFLDAGEALGVLQVASAAISVGLGLLPTVATLGSTVLVYRVVPLPRPSWQAALVPGIAVGIVLTVIARLFAFVAPLLIGATALLGTLATVFVALAWLALSFQSILVGAAWVRDRADRSSPAGERRLQS